MNIHIEASKETSGSLAAKRGADLIRKTITLKGSANIILATGASQFEMLENLSKEPIDWSKVRIFHLDEYVGLSIEHPASFRKYLKERVIQQLPSNPIDFHELNGETDSEQTCQFIGELLKKHPIDVAFIGIGENAHIAFNDPPANFETESPYLVVTLDEACRQQQFKEGWFKSFQDVPQQAISMSVRQILKSKTIICTVPDDRKAEAVRQAIEGEVTPLVPASILKTHPDCYLYLDQAAASLLKPVEVV